ncbi:unnamed protein product [Mytilus coruscus]|uniref:Uncharacterized protein n=1 Tax=Mytilus coruscus TaxID=42192 RepID=A0A6J8EKN4_MYTCO|nr:unnamed protein product [Mytilus coruscus]
MSNETWFIHYTLLKSPLRIDSSGHNAESFDSYVQVKSKWYTLNNAKQHDIKICTGSTGKSKWYTLNNTKQHDIKICTGSTVFLYDSNYDLKLKSTEAEEKKAQRDQGKIDIVDVNTVTREYDSNSTKQEIQNESNKRVTQEIINRLKNLEGSLTELKDTKKMMMDKLQSMEESLKHGSRNDMNGS